jgi:hypothetical protein
MRSYLGRKKSAVSCACIGDWNDAPIDPVDDVASRVLGMLSRLTMTQRDRVVERILRADPALESVVWAYVTLPRLRLGLPFRRDALR